MRPERFKNVCELLNLRAVVISMLYQKRIFHYTGKIFCMEFERCPLKFHMKYLTNTLKGENLKALKFKGIFETTPWLKSPTGTWERHWGRMHTTSHVHNTLESCRCDRRPPTFCRNLLNGYNAKTYNVYSISQEICTRFLLCCALLWLYIDWFSHIHQAYFTGTVAI